MHWNALFEIVSEGKGYTIKAGLAIELLVGILVVVALVAFYKRTNLELEKVEVELSFLGIKTEWKPDMTERIIAWKIYIELLTRISLQPLKADEGLVREALNSFYKLFQNMRLILQEGGPRAGLTEDTIGYITIKLMNERLRPFLAEWHPKLQDWEAKNTTGLGRQAYEKRWEAEVKASRSDRATSERPRSDCRSICQSSTNQAAKGGPF